MGKKKFGDRKDAKRIRNIDGLSQILIDLKPKRSLGEVYINQKMDVTELVKYVEKVKKEHEEYNITYFHALSTIVGKTIYNRPKLNRFIANRHVFEHNDVSLSYVMKQKFDDKSEEIMVIMPILGEDNIFSIAERTSKKTNSVRNENDGGTGANSAIQVLGKLPNILRVPIIGLFKLFDRKGWLPNALIKDNIYYSSLIVSNLGTLKCGGIYHNVTDFGTCSGLLTMGEIKEELVDGKKKYFCEFGVTLDERIADGYYYVKSLHLMQYIMNNPKLLEDRADEKIDFE